MFLWRHFLHSVALCRGLFETAVGSAVVSGELVVRGGEVGGQGVGSGFKRPGAVLCIEFETMDRVLKREQKGQSGQCGAVTLNCCATKPSRRKDDLVLAWKTRRQLG